MGWHAIRGWELGTLGALVTMWAVARLLACYHARASPRLRPVWPVPGPCLAGLAWLGIGSIYVNGWLNYVGRLGIPFFTFWGCLHVGGVIVLVGWAFVRHVRRGLGEADRTNG